MDNLFEVFCQVAAYALCWRIFIEILRISLLHTFELFESHIKLEIRYGRVVVYVVGVVVSLYLLT